MIVPQLQMNITHKSADQGVLADLTTGGRVAYLSPGLTASVMHNLQVYVFVQLPLYSNLDGHQLFPHYWTTSVGVSHDF